jgi:hypothetical protein
VISLAGAGGTPGEDDNMNTPTKSFRSSSPLEAAEIKILVDKGAKLFELMTLTPDAEKYLEFNPELARVIAKW